MQTESMLTQKKPSIAVDNKGSGFSWRFSGEATLWVNDKASHFKKLYDKGVDAQWNPDKDIDWSIEVPFGAMLAPDAGLESFLKSPLARFGVPFWNNFRWQYQVWLVSQFLHGEESALMGALRIAQSITGIEAKKAISVQIMDEARHSEVFARYLDLHAPEGIYPVTPPFAKLVTESLSHSNWDFVLLGTQVLIEGVAMAAFRMAEATLHDELIRSIVRLVHRDEARHTAIGQISLKGLYDQLSECERRERCDFLAAAAELTAQRFLLEDIWDRMGINVKDGVNFAATDKFMLAYRRTVFAKVISIIHSVGLMDNRLERDLTLLGFSPRRGLHHRCHN